MTISTVTLDDTLSTVIPDDPPLPVAWEEQLCSKCMSIAFGRKSLKYLLSPIGYRHHKISELWESVASGCRLCSLIIDEVLHYTFPPEAKDKQSDIQKNPNVYVYISACNPKLRTNEVDDSKIPEKIDKFAVGWGSREGQIQYEIEYRGSKSYPSLTIFRDNEMSNSIKFSLDDDSSRTAYPKALPTHFSVVNSQVITEMERLRNICATTHGSMCPPDTPSFLPPRVVDIESPNSTGLSLHLSDSSEKGYYACLSYCWGLSSHHFMTTKKSLRDPASFDWSHPPATIADAIRVTRTLGLRYLWIDALCIVQDDEEDKIQQIKSMTRIYKNASIVIAAASSSNIETGFLQERTVPYIPLPVISESGKVAKLLVYTGYQNRLAKKEPLDRRGWALQEFLLAPRLLYYGSKDLIWKCLGNSSHSVTGNLNPYGKGLFPSLAPEVMGVKYGKIRPSDQYKIWRFIQASYSHRVLKKNDDRYRALGAVAEAIQVASTDQYLAGLWRDDIIDGLVWCSELRDPEFSQSDFCEDEDLNQIPPSPSWSWLSRLRPVGCYGASRDEVDPLTLVSWSLDFADDNSPFGHIRGGSLKILATTVQSKDVPQELTTVRNEVLFQCRLDALSSSSSLYEKDCSAFVGDQYLYLRVGFSINPGYKQSRWLLLESIDGGVYVRRGLIFIKEDENEVPEWQMKYGKRMTVDIV